MIDFEAIADLDAPIEPWQPKVGDRVRVRLSGECSAPLAGGVIFGTWESTDGGGSRGHDPREDGLTGSVVRLFPYSASHDYMVRFDGDLGFTSPNGRMVIGHTYAACELEPIPEAVS